MPSSYSAGDLLLLFVGVKHRSGTPLENSLGVPYGWNLVGCSLDKGGYSGAALNEGNTSVYVYSKIVKTGETVTPVTFEIGILRPGSLVVDNFFGVCDGYYSSDSSPIRVSFCPGGGDVRSTMPYINMDYDCGIMANDRLVGLFVCPTHWPYAFGRFSNAFFASDGFSSPINSDGQFSLQANYNIGGLFLTNTGMTPTTDRLTSIAPPAIRTLMEDDTIYARGAAAIVALSTAQWGLEEVDTFSAEGSVPSSVAPQINLVDDYGQQGTSSFLFTMPPVSEVDATAMFGFVASAQSTLDAIPGWTKLGTFNGGGGTYGIDTGPRDVAVYRKDSLSVQSGWVNTPITYITSNYFFSTSRNAYFDPNKMCVTHLTFGADLAKDTAWSSTAEDALDLKPGDLIYVYVSFNTDISNTFSNPALTLAGHTFTSHGLAAPKIAQSTGNDGGHCLYAFSVDTAGDPGTPVFTMSTSAAVSGCVAFLHVTTEDWPVSTGFLYTSEGGEDGFSSSGTVAWATNGTMAATEDAAEDVPRFLGWLFTKGGLSFGAIGTGANGSTFCAPRYPSGITTADLLLCFICSGGSTQPTPTMPTGWTRLCTFSGGNNATYAADTGKRRVTVFRKNTTTGSESGTVTVSLSLSSGNTMRAHIARFRATGPLSGVVLSTATAASVNYAAYIEAVNLSATSLHFSSNSIYAVLVAQSKDSATPSNPTLSLLFDLENPEGPDGFDINDNVVLRASTAVTTGNDHRFVLYTAGPKDFSYYGGDFFDYVAELAPYSFAYRHDASATTCGAVAVVAMSCSAPGEMRACEDVAPDQFESLGYIGSVNPYVNLLKATEPALDSASFSGVVIDRPRAYYLENSTYGFSHTSYGLQVSVDAPTEAGDLIFIFVGTHDIAPANVPSINGWTRLATVCGPAPYEATNYNTGSRRATVFYKVATGNHQYEWTDPMTGLTANSLTCTMASCIVVKKSVASGYDFNIQVVTDTEDVLDANWALTFAPDLSIPTPTISCLAAFSVWNRYGIAAESPLNFELPSHELNHIADFQDYRGSGYYIRCALGIRSITYPQGPGPFENFETGTLTHNQTDPGPDYRTGAGLAVLVSLIPTGGFGPLGTLSVSETDDDVLAASGTVGGGTVTTTGTMAASESGADVLAAVGKVVVKGALAVSETGADALVGSGKVVVTGALSVAEAGSDSFASSGKVITDGALAAAEADLDAMASAGKLLVRGTLFASEADFDFLSAAGKLLVAGQLSCAEETVDVLASAGRLIVAGSLFTTEVGQDVLAGTGTAKIVATGTLSVTEGSDTMAASGKVLVRGSLAVAEAGFDATTGTGKVLVRGSALFAETGADTATSSGKVLVRGSLASTETDADTLASTGKILVSGSLFAQDGPDTFVATGGQAIQGSLSVAEPVDAANFTGKVLVNGSLGVAETGADEAISFGSVLIHGNLAGIEPPDSAQAAGRVLVDGQLLASEDPDLAAMLGGVLIAGPLLVMESDDTLAATGYVLTSAPEESIILADISDLTIYADLYEGTLAADLSEAQISANIENSALSSDTANITLEASL
jgi:hypothetical protein